jgi:haloacetate dehalogenase
MLTDFQAAEIQTGETSIFVRHSGSGPPVLLLHGFPKTHLMWRDIAPVLARHFTVVCADLRGDSGQTTCAVRLSTPDISFRKRNPNGLWSSCGSF